MPESPTLHVHYDENEGRTRVRFAGGDSEDLLLTPVGDDLYRLEESSLLREARYMDVIRASRLDDGGLLFLGVETPSDLVHQEWLLSKEIINAPAFRSILERVMEFGGN